METAFPGSILGGSRRLAPLSDSVIARVARDTRPTCSRTSWEKFRGRARVLDLSLLRVGGHPTARSSAEAGGRPGRAAGPSCSCSPTGSSTRATAATSTPTLRSRPWTWRCATTSSARRDNLRRRCGLVLRSAAIRNVHDVMVALGLGADGLCPYTMVEVALMDDYRRDVANLAAALRKGIEKVISTIGIHEVRGYARLFSCIGLKPELAAIFDTPAYFGSEGGGTGLAELDRDGDERRRVLAGAQRPSRCRPSASTRRSTRPRWRRRTARRPTRTTRCASASWRRAAGLAAAPARAAL